MFAAFIDLAKSVFQVHGVDIKELRQNK